MTDQQKYIVWAAVTGAWDILDGSTPKPVHAHKDGCRWPVNEQAPYLFCNEPTERENRPYCARHNAIAFLPPEPDKPKKKVPRFGTPMTHVVDKDFG